MNPELIQGGTYTDARGVVRFCNDFDMSAVKRFYTIANSAEQPVRGWIGHKRETKWFFPIKGTTTIAVEPMADDVFAAKNAENSKVVSDRFVLNANEPKVLRVPSGNWFCIWQNGDAEVMVFSDCRVGEYENDDFRRPVVKEVFGQD